MTQDEKIEKINKCFEWLNYDYISEKENVTGFDNLTIKEVDKLNP